MKRRAHSVFVSYAHTDKDRVLPLASYLGRLGLKVWMDTKRLAPGQTIVEKVSEAISDSDVYMVCISPSALSSKWVIHELNTALSLEITQGRPRVVPVIVSKAELPAMLSGRLYIDVAASLDRAKESIKLALESTLPGGAAAEIDRDAEQRRLILSSVGLELREKTYKNYGGLSQEHDKGEVEEEAAELIKTLRRKANGILLNFVSASEMDFSTPHPTFPNGSLSERMKDTYGELSGSLRKVAVVELQILNPDEGRMSKLVSSKLASLGVARISYSFQVSPPIRRLPQIVLERLQEEYVILGWDMEKGADVELPNELTLSVCCSEEEITLAIETKYDFLFESRAKEFSVRKFIDWLIKDRAQDSPPA